MSSTSTFTYDDNIYSDLYKEVYNHRPCAVTLISWAAKTPEEKQVEWDCLLGRAPLSLQQELGEEWDAMVAFEALVDKVIADGAKTRETAIRWLRGEHEELFGNDIDYFCFVNGLPFGYFGDLR